MKSFTLLTRQDKTRQDNEISLNFSNDLLLSILYYFQSIFSLHNFFNHIVFNNISIISTINQSILKELKTLVFESKHFLKMFIIKINFKESSL